jgi:gliding motility-associated-like protein
VADFTLPDSVVTGDIAQLTDRSTGASGLQWLPTSLGLAGTQPSFRPREVGPVEITLVATNAQCTDTVTKTLWVVNLGLQMPNVFSPNADGLNDFFRPIYWGYNRIHLQIWDRWGILIFDNRMITGQWWDGTKNGTPCQEGVYVYRVAADRDQAYPLERYGTVTLLR